MWKRQSNKTTKISSTGNDGLPAILLKHGGPKLTLALKRVFKECVL